MSNYALFNTLKVIENRNSYNMRVGCRVGQCSLFESYDSNVCAVCFGRDRSDPAAHANHYGQLITIKNNGVLCLKNRI